MEIKEFDTAGNGQIDGPIDPTLLPPLFFFFHTYTSRLPLPGIKVHGNVFFSTKRKQTCHRETRSWSLSEVVGSAYNFWNGENDSANERDE